MLISTRPKTPSQSPSEFICVTIPEGVVAFPLQHVQVKCSAAAVYVPLLFTAYSKEEKDKLGHYFKQGFPLEAAPLSNG